MMYKTILKCEKADDDDLLNYKTECIN